MTKRSDHEKKSCGPLAGFKIIELAGIGPGPMAGMLLADMGAEVILVERSARRNPLSDGDISFRGKRSVVINLKHQEGRDAFLRLIQTADAVIEGFRPGVAERLGVGPKEALSRNPRLVYGRITGWGQDGPLANAAGHDINYIALAGALFAIGHADARPTIPLNLIGDMGGGGMLLAFGILCGLLHAKQSGHGQVIDAAMVDGVAILMWLIHSLHAKGNWSAQVRGTNLLDGGAPYYDVYRTRDNQYVCIGSIEPQFYSELLRRLGINEHEFADQSDRQLWPHLRNELEKVFARRTRSEWQTLLEGTDVCFAPVLAPDEVASHPHNKARQTYWDIGGTLQPAPAPRFSRTPGAVRHPPQYPGQDTEVILKAAGYSSEHIADLKRTGAIV